MERERFPEAWIGKRVNLTGAPSHTGILRDVNEFGITIETLPRHELRFLPWGTVMEVWLSPPTQSQEPT